MARQWSVLPQYNVCHEVLCVYVYLNRKTGRYNNGEYYNALNWMYHYASGLHHYERHGHTL
jgi:hypothetical protein